MGPMSSVTLPQKHRWNIVHGLTPLLHRIGKQRLVTGSLAVRPHVTLAPHLLFVFYLWPLLALLRCSVHR